ncbi:MAG: SH3 domain-containing protein [Chloroflexi bacterium]|nr:SH3 domain-containing protein [Chloroflexota bacterium]
MQATTRSNIRFAKPLGCIVCVILMMLAVAVTPAVAQDDGEIIADIAAFMLDWQVWLWRMGETAPVQLTDFADEWRVGSITVSPDGYWITFLAHTPLAEPRQYPGYERDTLWLYDVAAGDLLRIDGLPEPQDSAEAGRYMLGAPQFAPDGGSLMWLEVDWEAQSQLIFYDLVQRTRRSIPSVASWGYQDGGDVALPYLLWGGGGLLNTVGTFREGSEHLFVEVIDPITASKQVFDLWQEAMGHDQYPRDITWAYASAEAATAQVIAFRQGDAWYALDPVESIITRYAGAPTTTQAGFTVLKRTETREDTTTYTVRSLATASGEPVVLPEWSTGYTVSTGGSGVLFVGPEAIGVLEADGIRLFELPPDPDPEDADRRFGSPAGADEQVRFVDVEALETSSIPFETVTACFLPPRLEIGQSAVVVPGAGANVLREEAGLDGAEIGSIPEGAQVIVLDGSVCRDGYRWWQVDYDGQIGWTAEGDPQTGDYWLEAVQEDGD